ncbi:transposase (fragment) [Xenorhabdus bovienii str. kraussei Quebec]|uniref:Transposase n=1 Tax=Xenorhabdus bovienii str. kraussei Quebec TaxID=1398203 RepID=A0A077PEC9_XENBV
MLKSSIALNEEMIRKYVKYVKYQEKHEHEDNQLSLKGM